MGCVCIFLRRVDVIPPRRVDIVIDPLCFFRNLERKRRLLFDRFESGATLKVEILVVLGCVDEASFLSFVLVLGGCFVRLSAFASIPPRRACSLDEKTRMSCRVAQEEWYLVRSQPFINSSVFFWILKLVLRFVVVHTRKRKNSVKQSRTITGLRRLSCFFRRGTTDRAIGCPRRFVLFFTPKADKAKALRKFEKLKFPTYRRIY